MITTVYIIVGITCLHLALAAINAVGIKGAFFVKTSTKPLCLAFNWLIPLVGPIATYVIVRDSFSDKSTGSPVKDKTGNVSLYLRTEEQGEP